MGSKKATLKHASVQAGWYFVVVLSAAIAVAFFLFPLLVLIYGRVADWVLLALGVLVVVLNFRKSAGKRSEYAFFAFLIVCGSRVIWQMLTREEREWLATVIVLGVVIGVVLAVAFIFRRLKAMFWDWLDRRSYERDPAGRDAYAAWLKTSDKEFHSESDRV